MRELFSTNFHIFFCVYNYEIAERTFLHKRLVDISMRLQRNLHNFLVYIWIDSAVMQGSDGGLQIGAENGPEVQDVDSL
jgi:hypothetical protein